MAHRVKVMKENTFRFNVSVTPPYNADFDGDEMNIFVPQSIQTSIELEYIADVTRQIISPESASYVLKALQEVVQDGTAPAANIKGFSVAGKTGTAHQIRGRSGYAEDLYIASFAGITPLSDESLTIFVSINNPGLNSYTGGAVAAPVFAKIAESSLNHLGYFEDE